jgi:hypothetical protein
MCPDRGKFALSCGTSATSGLLADMPQPSILPGESANPAPKSVFPWKNNGLRDAQLRPQGIKFSLTMRLDW